MSIKRMGFVVFLCLLGFSCFCLIPRTYLVLPFKERPNTQYWDLSTGSRIGYTLIKSPSEAKATPIIYLHGGPGGIVKDETIATLQSISEEGFDIYCYDQIGSGHSNRLEIISEYSVSRHQKDLEEIVKIIGAKKVILLGHSWGAMLATRYLVAHPGKVAQMILSGPGPILPFNASMANRKSPDSLNLKKPTFSNQEANQKADNLRSKAIRYFARLFNKKLASDAEADDFFTFLTNELNKATVKDIFNREEASGGGGYYVHIMTVKSFREVVDQRAQMQTIEVPTLILKGQYDNQKWGYAAEYLALLPGSKLKIIEHAGHHIIREQPKIFVKIINDFLRQPL